MAEQPKKVLIITYYWPPSGGAGVQRWLKFVKYLQEFNWEPVVYTPKNNEIPVYDDTLEKDIPDNITILKKDIWEPYTFYKRFIGAKKDEKFNIGGFISENKNYGLKDKISTFIRGNFFIPDARKFWIKPSFRFLKKYLKNHPVDLIVTTGPPHSMHLIGLKLKKSTSIPWIADFRDPWTRLYMYHDLMLTKWADLKHKKLEKKVLQSADHVLTVGWTLQKEFEEMGAKDTSVITNGYDKEDFENIEPQKRNGFCIVQTGNISRSKNSTPFWEAISELCDENKDFKKDLEIRLAGKLDFTVDETIRKYQLGNKVKKLGYLPHEEVIKEQKSATILLMMTTDTAFSKNAIPGRTFEYLAAKRPIVAIANPESDMAKIINKTEAGVVIDFDQKKELKQTIQDYYYQYKQGKISVNPGSREEYSRKNLSFQLTQLFNTIANT